MEAKPDNTHLSPQLPPHAANGLGARQDGADDDGNGSLRCLVQRRPACSDRGIIEY